MIQGPAAWPALYSFRLLAETAAMYDNVGQMRPRVQQGIVSSESMPRSPVLISLRATFPLSQLAI